jgi:hypothetical protein
MEEKGMATMLVKAITMGYYDHKRRYPAGEGKPGAGEPFPMGDEILRRTKTGDIIRDADGNPVLPKWVIPAEPFPAEWMPKKK